MQKGRVTTCIGSSNNRVCMGKCTMMTGYRLGIHDGYHLTNLARLEDGQGFSSFHNLSKDQAQSSRQWRYLLECNCHEKKAGPWYIIKIPAKFLESLFVNMHWDRRGNVGVVRCVWGFFKTSKDTKRKINLLCRNSSEWAGWKQCIHLCL